MLRREGLAEIPVKGAEGEDLFFTRFDFQSLGNEEHFRGALDEDGHAAFGEESGGADAAEGAIAGALDEGDEAVALEDEVGLDLGDRQELNVGGGEAREDLFHYIL
jgi:hypothetical protein